MITITSDQFEFLLPVACDWAEAKEKVVLKHGINTIRQHAIDFISARIAPQLPKNDGN